MTLRVPARIFAVFDEEAGQWSWPAGEFTVQAGRSSRNLRLAVTLRSGDGGARPGPAGRPVHDGATSSTS